MNKSTVELVIAKAGGMRALARALGINYQAIQSWKEIPAKRVLEIEQATGIPREQLRPDLYGPPRAASRSKKVPAKSK